MYIYISYVHPDALLTICIQPNGCFFGLSTVDPGTNERSYAAMARLSLIALCITERSSQGFYRLYENRSNYHVLTNANVHKILLTGDEPDIVATGVQFDHTGSVYEVAASKEVIVCAGSIFNLSPQAIKSNLWLSGRSNHPKFSNYLASGTPAFCPPMGFQSKLGLKASVRTFKSTFFSG